MKSQLNLTLMINDPALANNSAFKGNKKKLTECIRKQLLKTKHILNYTPNLKLNTTRQIRQVPTDTPSTNTSYPNTLRNKFQTIYSLPKEKLSSKPTTDQNLIMEEILPNSNRKQFKKHIYFNSDNLKQRMNEYLNIVLQKSLDNQRKILMELQPQGKDEQNKKKQQKQKYKYNNNFMTNSFFRKIKSSQTKRNKSTSNSLLQLQQMRKIRQPTTQHPKLFISSQNQINKRLKNYIITTPNLILTQ